jgi:autotransporter-associated beta strand protein
MSARTFVGLVILILLWPALANAVAITPIFTSPFNTTEQQCIQEAIQEWSNILGGPDGFTLAINFICNNNLGDPDPITHKPGPLGETSGWAPPGGRPTSATIVIDNNDHNWTTGAPAAGQYDAQQTLKHEIAHALGFTVQIPAFADHVETVGTNRFFDMNGDGEFNNSDLNLIDNPAAGTHTNGPGGLLAPAMLPGQRAKPFPLVAAALAKAYGYKRSNTTGFWNNGAYDGLCSNEDNWLMGIFPYGEDQTAIFGQETDIAGVSMVNMDDDMGITVIGALSFKDLNPMTPGTWEVNDTSTFGNGVHLAVTMGIPSIETMAHTILNVPISGEQGLRKTGFAKLTLANSLNYTGPTIIEQGVLEISSAEPVSLSEIIGPGVLEIGGGSMVHADMVQINILTIGAGSRLTINPLPGGPLGGSIQPVPEPGTLALLSIVAIYVMGIALRRKRWM